MRRLRVAERNGRRALAVFLREPSDPGGIYGSALFSGVWHTETGRDSWQAYRTTRDAGGVVMFADGQIGIFYRGDIDAALRELGLRRVNSTPISETETFGDPDTWPCSLPRLRVTPLTSSGMEYARSTRPLTNTWSVLVDDLVNDTFRVEAD